MALSDRMHRLAWSQVQGVPKPRRRKRASAPGAVCMTPRTYSRRQLCGAAGALGLALTIPCAARAAGPSADVLARRRTWATPSESYTPFYELFESEVVRSGSWTSPLPDAGAPFEFSFEFDGRSYTL